MNFKNLFGLILGAIITFIIIGLVNGNFEWDYLIIFIFGGVIGYIGLAIIKKKKS